METRREAFSEASLQLGKEIDKLRKKFEDLERTKLELTAEDRKALRQEIADEFETLEGALTENEAQLNPGEKEVLQALLKQVRGLEGKTLEEKKTSMDKIKSLFNSLSEGTQKWVINPIVSFFKAIYETISKLCKQTYDYGASFFKKEDTTSGERSDDLEEGVGRRPTPSGSEDL